MRRAQARRVPNPEPRTPNPEPRTSNLEPGTWNHRTWNQELWNLEPRYTSSSVSRTYVRVVLLETAIIIALVIFGRLFS
jgi:hypothetical protein